MAVALIAMQFTSEIQWETSDFVVMGIMVLVFGSLVEFARVYWRKKRYLGWLIMVIIAIFLFLWVEMAVGIVGSPIAGS